MACHCYCIRKYVLPYQLFVFDFDRTIVNGEADEVYKQVLAERRDVPTDDKSLNLEFDWEGKHGQQPLIDHVIAHGVKPDAILATVREMDTVMEIEKPLAKVKKFIKKFRDSRLLILSATSNDLFIEHRLTSLEPAIHASTVIAHHAEVSESRHHLQYEDLPNPDPKCPMCRGDFCKGQALVNYMDSLKEEFLRIHLVGASGSDLCAALRLSQDDYLYVRAGEELDNILQGGYYRGMKIYLKVNVVYWSTGYDLAEEFEQFI